MRHLLARQPLNLTRSSSKTYKHWQGKRLACLELSKQLTDSRPQCLASLWRLRRESCGVSVKNPMAVVHVGNVKAMFYKGKQFQSQHACAFAGRMLTS